MKRSHLAIMGRLIKLVVPLLPFMILAIVMGVVGFLCSTFITIFGGYALLDVLNYSTWIDFETVCIAILFFALIRRVFYAMLNRLVIISLLLSFWH